MRSVRLFGKGIPLLAVAIVMTAGIGGAYLVDYLSNKVTAEVTVSSPMAVGISEGRESWADFQCWRSSQEPIGWTYSFPEGANDKGGYLCDWDESDWAESTITISDIRGGETITLYTMSRNLADAEIKGHEEIIVTNWAGVTQEDFVTITSRFDSIYGDLGYGRLHTDVPSEDVQQIDDWHIELWSADDTSTWGAGETDVARWDITFKTNASGTYTFTYQVVPVAELE